MIRHQTFLNFCFHFFLLESTKGRCLFKINYSILKLGANPFQIGMHGLRIHCAAQADISTSWPLQGTIQYLMAIAAKSSTVLLTIDSYEKQTV